jgi:hypothetical protein
MSNKSSALIFVFIFSVVLYFFIIGMMYAWLRLVHSPLKLYQRRMLTFFAMFLAAIPVLNPAWVASAWWLTSLRTSVTITILVFVAWGAIAFQILRSMSAPGGHLSE